MSDNIVQVNQIVRRVEVTTPGPAGRDGSSAAVSKIIAGSNVTISPTSGLGDVTVNATSSPFTPAADSGTGSAVSSTLTIAGTTPIGGNTPIATAVSGTTVSVQHATAAGSGVSTAFPGSVTVDSWGHVVGVGSSAPPAQQSANLSDLDNIATARTNLGATTVGNNVFTAANAAAARSAIGAGTGSGDVVASNNLSDLANAGTARTNLGLGSSSTLDVPSSGDAASGEVVKGTDTRLTDARTPTTTLDHDADKITSGTLTVARGGTGLSSISTLLNSNTTKSDVGLGNVENTAISTFAGTSNITTVGTITSGTWSGTAIGYGSLSGKPSLGTASQYNAGVGSDNILQANAAVADDDFLRVDGTKVEGRTAAEVLSDIGAFAASGVSSFGATLIDDADAATARTTLGAQATLTSPVTSPAMTGVSAGSITGVIKCSQAQYDAITPVSTVLYVIV